MPRALVTGSAGFIGRNMVAELRSRGYEVMNWDIQEGWNVNTEFSRAYNTRYDLVVHCAYHVGGRAAIDGQNTNFAKNLQLDAAMFEWAVRTQQGRVLYFSSSAAYPVSLQRKCDYCDKVDCPAGPSILKEDDIDLSFPELPDANYGWAKLTGERLAQDARASGLPVTVVRPFSGYGADQSLDYPFPSIVRRAAGGELSVWGPKGQSRDWIHVNDVVLGSLAVAEAGTELPVNLGTGRAVEMGELAMMVFNRGYKGMRVNTSLSSQLVYDETKPTGVFYRVCDPSRFNVFYTPTVTLEEGIDEALSMLKSANG